MTVNCPLPDDMTASERQARSDAIERLKTYVKQDPGDYLDIGIREPAAVSGERDGPDCLWCEHGPNCPWSPHEIIFLLTVTGTGLVAGSCACAGCLDRLRGSVIPLGQVTP